MKVLDKKYDCKAKTVSIVLLIAAFSQSSCKENRKREDAAKIVKEWTGKEVKFPKELSCTSMGKDTACIDIYNDNYKILLYGHF